MFICNKGINVVINLKNNRKFTAFKKNIITEYKYIKNMGLRQSVVSRGFTYICKFKYVKN